MFLSPSPPPLPFLHRVMSRVLPMSLLLPFLPVFRQSGLFFSPSSPSKIVESTLTSPSFFPFFFSANPQGVWEGEGIPENCLFFFFFLSSPQTPRVALFQIWCLFSPFVPSNQSREAVPLFISSNNVCCAFFSPSFPSPPLVGWPRLRITPREAASFFFSGSFFPFFSASMGVKRTFSFLLFFSFFRRDWRSFPTPRFPLSFWFLAALNQGRRRYLLPSFDK